MGRPIQRYCPKKGHDKDVTGRRRDGGCLECYRIDGKDVVRRYRNSNAGRSGLLKRRYGITLAEYVAMFEDQEGLCPVCQEPIESVPHVDHDHATGRARGLIHGRCNLAVAVVESGLAARAFDYLMAGIG